MSRLKILTNKEIANIHMLKQQGLSNMKIADMYYCSDYCIRKNYIDWCNDNNVKPINTVKRVNLPFEEIHKLKQKNMSYVQIAKIVCFTSEYVRLRYKKWLETQKKN